MGLTPSPTRLSSVEQLMPRTYVRQMFCFPTTHPQAVAILRRGITALVLEIPYILARVVREEESGLLALSGPCQRPEDVFSSGDLSVSTFTFASISYAKLKAENFPPAAFLHPDIIPSDTVLPLPDEPAVFRARASVVAGGGLILCVAMHHAVTDITGLGSLLKVWASCCRGEIPSETIGFSEDWMDRTPLFAYSDCHSSRKRHELHSDDEVPDLLHIRTGAIEDVLKKEKMDTEIYKTAIFYFPDRYLRYLKDAVNAHLRDYSLFEPNSWVSTGDVLTSLLWSAVAIEVATPKAHLRNDLTLDPEPGASTAGARNIENDSRVDSRLSFPVQFRPILHSHSDPSLKRLPKDFLGAAFVMTSADVSEELLRRLVNSATDTETIIILATIALAIRRSIQAIDDDAVRRVLAYLEEATMNRHSLTSHDNSPQVVLGRSRKPTLPNGKGNGSAVTVVSWAGQEIYNLPWGPELGQCEAVRLPKMRARRDPVILPRHVTSGGSQGGGPNLRDGGDTDGLEVIMSYEDAAMERLIECPLMKRFAVLRCLS
ncbi:hypothetical protein F5Y17DRAFT_455903 [Xylariaceae sp. FL0594]|nr:hypothetical protein F5Y17DRAFT_455903 [Xylariaceae sp. FL0594]